MKKPHILIGGRRDVGKSALIRRLLENNSLPIYGYITQNLPPQEDGYEPIYIHPAAATHWQNTEANHIGDCNSRQRRINTSVFDTCGVEYLRHGRDGIIVMDEIGFMEINSPKFCDCVMACLNDTVPVLAAVKSRFDVEYLNMVRAHPMVNYYTLTEDNGQQLYETLQQIMNEWNERMFSHV